jgi:hypothetical protein
MALKSLRYHKDNKKSMLDIVCFFKRLSSIGTPWLIMVSTLVSDGQQ